MREIICAGIEWAIIEGDAVLFRGTREECETVERRIKMGFSVEQAIEFLRWLAETPAAS